MLSADEISRAVELALTEDVGSGDVTSIGTVPLDAIAIAKMVARERLVIAGLPLAEATFLDFASVEVERLKADGQTAQAGDTLLEIEGPARALLTAERVALNFAQRL